MKVVDASSLIDFLTNAEGARAIAHHLDDDLFAPDLLVAEVHQYLRRLERQGTATHDDLLRFRNHFAAATIEYLPTWPYAPQMWEWRHTITPYDAMYVALAHDLRCPLLTSDRRLANAVDDIVPVICVSV